MLDVAEWMPQGDWRNYEAYIAGSLATQFPGVPLETNVRRLGKRSGVTRQIDVLAHADELVAIECKYVGRKVDVKCVEAFIGMLNDVDIRRGVIVTAVGFTMAARRRAMNDSKMVNLEIILPEPKSVNQHRGAPLIWRGQLGISLGLIDGWTCDTELADVPGGVAMMMYPIGYTRQSAMRAAPVIYANFLTKTRSDVTLQELAAPHQDELLKDQSGYIFIIEQIVIADRDGVARHALLRRASGPPSIFGEEHALYIDYNQTVLLLVLCTPPGDSARLGPQLVELYRSSFALDIINRAKDAAKSFSFERQIV